MSLSKGQLPTATITATVTSTTILASSTEMPEDNEDREVGISTLTLNLRALLVDEDKDRLPTISLDEVAWHDTIDDCWLVVCDYVYNCTEFMKNHPGGHDVLLEYAGRDASLAFVGTGHSKAANRLLKKFLIGELPPHERIFRIPNGIKIGSDSDAFGSGGGSAREIV